MIHEATVCSVLSCIIVSTGISNYLLGIFIVEGICQKVLVVPSLIEANLKCTQRRQSFVPTPKNWAACTGL